MTTESVSFTDWKIVLAKTTMPEAAKAEIVTGIAAYKKSAGK